MLHAMYHCMQNWSVAVCCRYVDLWPLNAELVMGAGKAHGCWMIILDLR